MQKDERRTFSNQLRLKRKGHVAVFLMIHRENAMGPVWIDECRVESYRSKERMSPERKRMSPAAKP